MANDDDLSVQMDIPDSAFDDIDITNDYMFSTVMQDSALCIELLECLLPGRKIRSVKHVSFDDDGSEITDVQTQKTMSGYFGVRGVRLDVYLDDGRTSYNVEMQTTSDKALARRSRLYQSHIDVSLLKRGTNYDKLGESYVIFICKFDPFGEDRSLYSFQSVCDQNSGLRLKDGAYKLFFNTGGKTGDLSPELRELLSYMNDTQAFCVADSDNELIRNIDRAVNEAKMSPEWRDGFVIYQIKQREAELRGEERGRIQGRAEGEIKGRAEGRAEGEIKGRAEGEIKGRAEGEIKGRAEEKKLLVRNMLAKQLPDDLITDLSGLSISEVDEIRAEMAK